jgi:hypothetical protein
VVIELDIKTSAVLDFYCEYSILVGMHSLVYIYKPKGRQASSHPEMRFILQIYTYIDSNNKQERKSIEFLGLQGQKQQQQ